jgi:prolyl oligopeptidase
MRSWFALAVIALRIFDVAAHAADAPPVAPVRETVDDYHGVKIVDPYRYMETFTAPDVQRWVRGQADYAAKVLSALPQRDAILARIRELDEGEPWRLFVVRPWPDSALHYMKRNAADNLFKLCFSADGSRRDERVLIDPEKLSTADGSHVSLEFAVPSPDKRYIAYGLAAAGSEQIVLHVLDTQSGKDLPDIINRIETAYSDPTWLPDCSGFVYARRQKLPDDAPSTEEYKRTRGLLHKLGDDPENDKTIFSMGGSQPQMLDTDFPSVILTTGSPYAIGQIKHGDTPELTLYAAPLSELLERDAKEVAWQKICDAKHEVTEFSVHGSDIDLMTAAGAPRYRVVRTSLAKPSLADAQTIVPTSDAVISGIRAAHDALYVGLLEGVAQSVLRVPHDAPAKVEKLQLPPGEPSAYVEHVEADVDGVLLNTTSWTRATRTYAFDPKARTLTDAGLKAPGKYDVFEGYQATEVMVTSHDGVRVPLSIVHKTGITLDGSHPALVSGYGGYGHCAWPYHNSLKLAWLERGGVLAVAHVRGGGEFGREWHLAGRMATKPNTWKDFIACCEYLVREGYTSPQRLAGQGVSAGGILIGRAITERPDLFAAAIIGVGVSDALRTETTTNGVPNIKEFGSTQTREGFDGLLAMSPYAHVKDGEKYPAVLLTHGINDPRVEPWESAKMAARLQAATGSGKPVLFRVDYAAGHGIGSTKRQRQEQLADEYAFLLWQLGATQ